MNRNFWLPLICSFSLILAPITGCQPSDEGDQSSTVSSSAESDHADASDAGTMLESTWQAVETTTRDGFTIVTDGISAGTAATMDYSNAAWVWSADRSADGWAWIRENVDDATEWAVDTAGRTWAITESTTGDFSLWVQVSAADGVGWVRTNVPAAWEVVKDEAGHAWVWIGEHKVEVGVCAAVVTVVVAGLIVAPEAVAPAVVRGASVGAAKETTVFMKEVWENREDSTDMARRLNGVSRSTFMSIGQAVLVQCGAEVLAGG